MVALDDDDYDGDDDYNNYKHILTEHICVFTRVSGCLQKFLHLSLPHCDHKAASDFLCMYLISGQCWEFLNVERSYDILIGGFRCK